MAVVSELIRKEKNGALSFGDYTLKTKAKLDNFDCQGDLYKVKTFNEITKLEKNGMFAYESVPGTTVTNFVKTNESASFNVEGAEDAQITLGLDALPPPARPMQTASFAGCRCISIPWPPRARPSGPSPLTTRDTRP